MGNGQWVYFDVSNQAGELTRIWDRPFFMFSIPKRACNSLTILNQISLSDMGFYELKRQLSYKCELYGSKLTEADRWFPSSKTRSNCGHKRETLSLSERVFNCPHCRFSLDRDLNAAIDLKNVAASSTVSACGLENADVAKVKLRSQFSV